jgi:hypothetical protein
VDLDWKFGSTMVFSIGGFFQPADKAPNVGAKPGGREEEEGINEPRGPGGLYIVGGAM